MAMSVQDGKQLADDVTERGAEVGLHGLRRADVLVIGERLKLVRR